MTELTAAKRRANVRESQNYFSSKISELARYIGFGLVAISFGLLSSDSIFAKTLVAESTNMLIWAGLLGAVTVLADYVHLLLGWLSSSQAANNATGDFKLAGMGKVYRFFQDWIFFYLKQLAPLTGAILLLIAIARVVSDGHL